MFCPLLIMARPEAKIGLSGEHDCLKTECAWWNRELSECAILAIPALLDLSITRQGQQPSR